MSGLDPNAAAEMYRLIYDINRNDDVTVIMITHDIEAVKEYATHILHIGKTCRFGTKQELLKDDLYFGRGERND